MTGFLDKSTLDSFGFDGNFEIKKEKNYVNNKKLYEVFCDHKEKLKSDPDRQLPDFICESIIHISNNLSFSKNFINYPNKDDMIGDGVFYAFKYANNFDPQKSKNPFAYLTQVIYQSFVRRIKKEYRQTYLKAKIFDSNNGYMSVDGDGNKSSSKICNEDDEVYSNSLDIIDKYENSSMGRKPSKKKVDNLISNDNLLGILND